MHNKFYSYLCLFVIYVMGIIYIIFIQHFSQKNEMYNDDSLIGKLYKLHASCLIPCKDAKCSDIVYIRGQTYLANSSKQASDEIKNCFVTFWVYMHFIFYLCIGFILPDTFWESFIIGVLFEIFEYYFFDCYNALDIVANTLGFAVGYSLRKQFIG